ncbi:tetratricopeptide repeat protein [Nostoc sp.]|uniref:tetratricopeptide repeat protein n=1 Tax=Nostoc sp. TaxID=1180 RepID=UPI002FFCCCC6
MGREVELEELHQKLQTSRQVAIVAVAGMGGVGKTELATQYAKQHLQNYQGGVCWLSAQGIDVGIQILRFAELKFKLIAPDDWELTDRLRYCWQNWEKGEVLLVFDDVTDYKKQVQPYLPPESPRFKVLLTTRLGFDRTLPQLPLGVLKPLAAMKLLKSLVDRERLKSEPWVARKICQFLGYLPLALELEGRYLDTMPDLSLETLLKRLEKKRLEHEAIAKANPLMRYEYGVAEAIELSWEQLDENAQSLGCWLSLYALADIPFSVEAIKDDDEQELKEKAIAELRKLHLIQWQSKGIYRLHPLIRQFFQMKLDESSEADEVKTAFAAQMIQKARLVPEQATHDLIKEVASFIPHLAEVANNLTAYIRDGDLIFIFRGLGWFYQGQGLYEQAEPWLKECVTLTDNRLSSKHYHVSVSLNNLANLYKDQGRYNEAEAEYQQALELWKYLLVNSDIDFAIILDNLATLYYFQGKYSDAERLYFQALEIFITVLGDESLDVARTLNNLAAIYEIQEHYSEAGTLYRQVLEIRQHVQGENHPDFAQSLNNLAAFYEGQGYYFEAERLYRRALKLRKSLQGENHPDVAQILNNLGNLYNSQKRYGEAEPLLKKALEMRKRLHGENHPDVAQSLNNLAMVYSYTKRYDEAKPLLQKALELRKRLLRENHPDIATTLNNLAGLYSCTELYNEAKSLYLQALAILNLTLGVGHSRTMMIRENYEILLKKAYP